MERCFHCMGSTKEKGEGTIVHSFHHTGIEMSVVTLWEGAKNKCLFLCLSFSLLLSSISPCPVNHTKTQRITMCVILCGKTFQLPKFRWTFSYLVSTLLTSAQVAVQNGWQSFISCLIIQEENPMAQDNYYFYYNLLYKRS